MPGQGYEGVAEFVFNVISSRGVNACPPLLVGVGVSTAVETAARLSKKALMRPVGSHNADPNAAKMETLLEDGLNEMGIIGCQLLSQSNLSNKATPVRPPAKGNNPTPHNGSNDVRQ